MDEKSKLNILGFILIIIKLNLFQVKPKNFSIFASFQTTNNVSESHNSFLKNVASKFINVNDNSNIWSIIGKQFFIILFFNTNFNFLIKEFLNGIYKKTQTQLSDYIRSDFTARIRENPKKKKLIKDNVLATMYRKLRDGMSGFDFVEKFCVIDFEAFLIEESESLRDKHTVDLNHFIQPLQEIDINERKLFFILLFDNDNIKYKIFHCRTH